MDRTTSANEPGGDFQVGKVLPTVPFATLGALRKAPTQGPNIRLKQFPFLS